MKLTIKYIAITLLIISSQMSFAQTVETVSGKIIDSQSLPVEGAVIILYSDSGGIIAHDVTNQTGTYTIKGEVKDNYTLDVSHLSFAQKTHTFVDIDNTTAMHVVNFNLEGSTTMLDEIVLVGKWKMKDTIQFDLEKMSLQETDNLRDILEKIPDFRMNENGTIIYKGKNIDKILVNNKPSFESQNSIALESIEKSIVEGISLINNYSEDFNIDFNEDEQSVLNIDTKNQNQQIVDGDVEGYSGYLNKYEFRGKGLLFSPKINAFVTHNTNNIGKTSFSSKELQKLFNEKQPFSRYQGEALNMLFNSSENLQKDVFTSTNLTLRNQTQRLKTSALIYHVSPDRINSTIQNISSLNNTPLFDSKSISEIRSNAILGAVAVAYKVANNTILKYNLNSSFINETNNNTTKNLLYLNGLENGTNTLRSNNTSDIFSGFHTLSLISKLQKNMIFESKAAYFHEDTKFLSGYNVSNNSEISDLQNYRYDKNEIQGSLGLKYKFSDAFIPKVSFEYQKTDEAILDIDANQGIIGRNLDNYVFDLDIRGKDVVEGVDYGANIGLNPFTNRVENNETENNLFVPTALWVEYETRLRRYYMKYSSSRRMNELESGINTIQPFNNIWIGNQTLPLGFNTSNSFLISYDYFNMFEAQLFSISFNYQDQRNSLRRGFVKQETGISTYQLFIVDSAQDFSIYSYYSKTVSPLKYPTKIDFSINYAIAKYPTQVVSQEFDITNISISPTISVETITDNFVNFKFSSKLFFVEDNVQESSFKSTYTNNSFSVLLKDKNWRGRVGLIYDHNQINGITYARKNINIGLSYTHKKITYRLESRHLGEVLGIFENDAYNSQFSLTNGISSTIINDQSLNYVTFGVKIKL